MHPWSLRRPAAARLAWLLALSLWPVLALSESAEPVGREVVYATDDTSLHGYLVLPEGVEGRRPGVLVVHEWWGLNDYARRRARLLAELGYVALAVDMYGEGRTADHPDQAGAFAGKVSGDFPLARRRFEAAMDFLRAQPQTDPGHIAAIGYCFGGGVVLNMARAGIEGLDAVASFHGSLAPAVQAEPGQVQARILVLNGGADPFTTDEQIAAFKAEMDRVGADMQFVEYPGARHSFTNPGADALGQRFDLPLAYDAHADAESWRRLRDFLEETFAGPDAGSGD